MPHLKLKKKPSLNSLCIVVAGDGTKDRTCKDVRELNLYSILSYRVEGFEKGVARRGKLYNKYIYFPVSSSSFFWNVHGCRYLEQALRKSMFSPSKALLEEEKEHATRRKT